MANMEIATFSADPERALANFRTEGLHVEPDVFADGFCDRLVEVANTFPAIRAGDYRTVLQPHRSDPIFLEALKHAGVAAILTRILGGAVSGIQTQFFYGKPGTPGFQPHQDNKFVNAPKGAFASAWVALTDVSRDNGGLYVYPGTHDEPLLEVEELEAQETMLQDLNALRLRCVVPEKYRALDLAMGKGSVTVLDGHTIHGSHANASNRFRYALLMTYVRRNATFVPGRYAQREEIPIN